MFCSKCGKEIDDEAVVCTGCGCPTQNYKVNSPVKETDEQSIFLSSIKSLTTPAILCAILFPIIGFILGIVGLIRIGQVNSSELSQAGKFQLGKYRETFISSIVLSVLVSIFFIIIVAALD